MITSIEISLPESQLELLTKLEKQLSNMTQPKEWLTIAEVCSHFNVKESTIRKWMRDFQMPYSSIDEVKGFNVEKINKWFLKFSSDDFSEGMKIISKRKAA